MALSTYLDRSTESTPTRSPRTVISAVEYNDFFQDMDHNNGGAGMFEIISTIGSYSGVQNLSSSKIILLLTPVVLDVTERERKKAGRAQDPFEPFGKKLSRRHSRIRHVPYLAKIGLTETHYTFAREAGAIIYITMQDVETKVESDQLHIEQSKKQSGHAMRTPAAPIIHLRFSQSHARADSPRADLIDPVYPNDQDFEDAIKLLYPRLAASAQH